MTRQNSFSLAIMTPREAVVSEAQVFGVVVPAHWGQMEILPQHTDFVTSLQSGEVTYSLAGQQKGRALNISGGLLVIKGNHVTILADSLLATVTPIDSARRKAG